jgi:hypothetical protein
MLRYFYARSQSEGEYLFDRDQDNIIQFSLQVLQTFRSSFKNLLCGKVRLFRAGKSRVVPNGYFRKEFEKIDTLIESLGKLS